jgi:hypothetical protein
MHTYYDLHRNGVKSNQIVSLDDHLEKKTHPSVVRHGIVEACRFALLFWTFRRRIIMLTCEGDVLAIDWTCIGSRLVHMNTVKTIMQLEEARHWSVNEEGETEKH